MGPQGPLGPIHAVPGQSKSKINSGQNNLGDFPGFWPKNDHFWTPGRVRMARGRHFAPDWWYRTSKRWSQMPGGYLTRDPGPYETTTWAPWAPKPGLDDDQGPGPRARDQGQGPRARDQGPGPRARDQGTKGQGPRALGPGTRDQGTKGQGPWGRVPGPRDQGTRAQGPRARAQG